MQESLSYERPTISVHGTLCVFVILIVLLVVSMSISPPTAPEPAFGNGSETLLDDIMTPNVFATQDEIAPELQGVSQQQRQKLLHTEYGVTLMRAYRKTGIFWGYKVVAGPVNSRVVRGEVILQVNGQAVKENEDGAHMLIYALMKDDTTLLSVRDDTNSAKSKPKQP